MCPLAGNLLGRTSGSIPDLVNDSNDHYALTGNPVPASRDRPGTNFPLGPGTSIQTRIGLGTRLAMFLKLLNLAGIEQSPGKGSGTPFLPPQPRDRPGPRFGPGDIIFAYLAPVKSTCKTRDACQGFRQSLKH